MRAYRIDKFITANENSSFMTRFGGQPDWITTPQWPISSAWDNRPLKFIGQIRLNDFYSELKDLTLAYIFITQPEDINDSFYDPDIIFPDMGENAIIIQPNGKIPEYVHVENRYTGLTVDSVNTWIPQVTEIGETTATEFEHLDIDKFCGIPALFLNSDIGTNSTLLLQLHTNWLPFYINAGGSPTMFAFLSERKTGGFILIEDL